MIPQGFQKDLERFLIFKLDKKLSNLDLILKNVSEKIYKHQKKLTWENYTNEHLKIWNSLKQLR